MRGLCLALALALLLTACGNPGAAPEVTPTPTAAPAETRKEERTFALAFVPGELHPLRSSSRVNQTWTPLVYRGLFALDRSFTPQKDLCAGYEVSEDGLTWTFTLGETVFSDGSPLTAAEAAASLELARKNDRYAPRLADVKRVDAQEGKLILTLSQPNGALPALLDLPLVKETVGDWPLGTGKYELTDRDGQLFLTARRGETVPLATIPLYPVKTADQLILAFDTGQVSLVDTDLLGVGTLGFSGRSETTDYPTSTLLYLGMNLAQGPCREAAVRRMVQSGLDRETLVNRELAGHAVPAALPWPGGTLPEEPMEALEKETALRLLVNQDNPYKLGLAQAVGEQLAPWGLTVTVEVLAWEEFTKALSGGDFDLYLGETALTADFDPTSLVTRGGTLNYGRVNSPELEAAIAAYRQAQGQDRAAALEPVWKDLVPLAPLCFKNGSMLTHWGMVSGAAPTQRDLFARLEDWRLGE